MRLLTALVLTGLLLATTGAAAQERVITYSTSVEPDLLIFEQDEFQKDDDGEYIRDDEGRLVPVRQYVTLTVEATMECAVAPDGEQIHFFSEGPAIVLRDASTSNVTSTYLDLDPRDFTLDWQQDGLGADWTASAVLEIDVVSNARPQNTLEGNYTWHIENVDIPQACPQDAWDENAETHRVVIPGDEFDPEDITDPETPDEPKGTPAPGLVTVLAALGLASARVRKNE